MDVEDLILLREIAAQGKRYTVGNVLATLSTPGRGRIPDAAHGQHFRCAVRYRAVHLETTSARETSAGFRHRARTSGTQARG